MKYPAYPAYKDSGVEWLGKIPKGWTITKIAHQVDSDVGFAFQSDQFAYHGIRLLRGENITEGETRWGDKTRYWDEQSPIPSRYNIEINDIVIGMDGSKVGRNYAIVTESDLPAYLVQRVARLRNRRTITHNFLAWLIASVEFKTYVDFIKTDTAIPHITLKDILSYPIPLPPLPTQKVIATFLDAETARIDSLIKDYEELITLLQEKRQALISHAVTRGLSELVNPDDPEFGKWAVPVKFIDSGVEWLGMVPEDWTVKRLKQIAEVSGGIAKGSGTSTDQKIVVPYLRVANVQDGHLNLEEISTIEIDTCNLPRFLLKKGDVLMNEGGDNDKLGRGTVWTGEIDPCIHQNHVFKVRPHEVDPRWVDSFTSSNSAKAYFQLYAKQSTNLASISMTNLSNVPMTYPPIPVQQAIVAFLDKETAKIDTLVDETQSAIELLKEHRSALITSAVTGKINVEGLI